MRSLRVRSSPGVCGPRSSSSVISALPARSSPQRRTTLCCQRSVRAPSVRQTSTSCRIQSRAVDHLVLGELHHRLAVRLLVGGGDQGVDGQGNGLRVRLLLLQQRAEDPDLRGVELSGDAGGHVRHLIGETS